uniref:Homeodomain interacting protein kinase 4 n=1 Tax=Pseudonaja textilis TaxID=8673 RepID=A0A670ZR72_PSETE
MSVPHCKRLFKPTHLHLGKPRTMVTIESESDFYDVFEILGKGTFGEVVKSWKRSTGEMVAIKILKNDSYRSRIIKNELKLLQTMSEVDSEESHIVQFHEFFHDELKFYLVFELLEQNLFDFQKEHNFSSLPVRHIRTVTMQVLRALAKLKELSIIHADLKPENIMLVDQVRYPFRVKVIDFGSLDMWSLGCVMAELHLGWPLYPGNNEYDQIRYICETQGMPRPALLNAARKAHLFFKRSQHPEVVNSWQLKTPADPLVFLGAEGTTRRPHGLPRASGGHPTCCIVNKLIITYSLPASALTCLLTPIPTPPGLGPGGSPGRGGQQGG